MSSDGRSPDSLAIWTCAKDLLKERLEIPAELACTGSKHVLPSVCSNLVVNNKIEDVLIVGCFDGAGVMVGLATVWLICRMMSVLTPR